MIHMQNQEEKVDGFFYLLLWQSKIGQENKMIASDVWKWKYESYRIYKHEIIQKKTNKS